MIRSVPIIASVLVAVACRPARLASDADEAIDVVPDTSAAPRQWVVGYDVGYEVDAFPIAAIDWSALTHVVFAPVRVNADGTLDLTFADGSDGPHDAAALANAAHENGVVPLLGLGGAGAGTTIAAAAQPAHLAELVQELLDAADALHFDGFDLDWEDHVNLDELVALAAALRAARPQIVLTYPAPAIDANTGTIDSRVVQLASYLDRVFVQTYYPATASVGDGWSSWFVAPLSGASHVTPVAIDDSLARYVAAGIPTSEIGMGVGLFAICYDASIKGPREQTTAMTQIRGGDSHYPLATFYRAGGTYDHASASERKRDAIAREPYLELGSAGSDSSCGGTTRYLSYEDESSLAAKGEFSRQHGYAGTIVWTLAQGLLPPNAAEHRAPTAMMDALRAAFLQ